MSRPLVYLATIVGLCATATAQDTPSFERDVLPILESRCYKCHRAVDSRGRVRTPKGGLRLDGKEWILRGGDNGSSLVPGNPVASSLYALVALDELDEDRMPTLRIPGSNHRIIERIDGPVRTWIVREGAEGRIDIHGFDPADATLSARGSKNGDLRLQLPRGTEATLSIVTLLPASWNETVRDLLRTGESP